LDGIHRFFAFKESGIKKIAAVEGRKSPLITKKTKYRFSLKPQNVTSVMVTD